MICATGLMLLLSACAPQPHSATDALPSNASPHTEALASAKDSLDAANALAPLGQPQAAAAQSDLPPGMMPLNPMDAAAGPAPLTSPTQATRGDPTAGVKVAPFAALPPKAGGTMGTTPTGGIPLALSPVATTAAPLAQTNVPGSTQIVGHGYAQIAGQPGKTANERRLMAMRAARLDAMRDLAEQINGIHISATTTVRDAVVQNDQLTAIVDGTLRGARTLAISPTGTDGFQVDLAIDPDTLAYMLRALQGRV